MKKEFKIIFIILMLVLAVFLTACDGDLAGEARKAIKRVKGLPAYDNVKIKCTDSDGGINLNEKGITKGMYRGKYKIKRDGCNKRGKVVEYFCDRNNKVKRIVKKCPSGGKCYKGSCLKCTDSDGGINLEEKGETKGLILMKNGKKKQVTKNDYCKRGKLREYFCGRDNKIKSKLKSCDGGGVCESGECVGGSLWTSLDGPPGAGRIRKLIQNPNQPYELYTLNRLGVYKSVNKGENWQLIIDSKNVEVESIVIFEDKLFVSGDGVYYLNEGNNDLIKINGGWWNEIFVSDNKLLISRRDGAIEDVKLMYVDLENSYTDLDSSDWNYISPSVEELIDLEPPSESQYQFSVGIPQVLAIENRIFANVILEVDEASEYTNGHLYVSKNNGETWDKVDLDLDIPPNKIQPIISNIIQNPNNPNHILLMLRHPIIHEYKYPISQLLRESYDGGITWQPVTDLDDIESNGFLGGSIDGLIYYLLDAYSGLSIFKLDGSNHKIIDMPEIAGHEMRLEDFLVDPYDSNIVYGKTGQIWEFGLVKSEDKMKTWKKMDKDITASSPTIVKIDPTDPNTIFTSSNILQEDYYTNDGGVTWKYFSPTASVDEVSIDPHNPNNILIVDEMTHVFSSKNGGQNFEEINYNGFYGNKIFDFEITSGNNKKIYVSNLGTGISQSDDFSDYKELGQWSWRHLTSSSDYAYDIEIDPDDENILYASYSPKIFENHSAILKYDPNDDGFGWSEILKVEKSKGITSLEFDKINSNNFYAGVVGEKGVIYHSNDKGDSWSNLNEDLTFSTIHAIAVDPNNENVVYAAPWGGGLFVSQDNGDSWQKIETPTISIPAIIVDPEYSNHLIIADRTAPKIYESFNAGQNWNELVSLDKRDYYRISTMVLHNGELYFNVFNKVTGMISLFVNGPMSGTTFKLDVGGTSLKNSNAGTPVEISNGVEGDIIINFFSDDNNLYSISHIYGVNKLEGSNWVDISPEVNMGFNNIISDGDNNLYISGASDIDMDLNFRIGDPNIVNNIYKSTNNGATWVPLLENNQFNSGIKKVLQHPTNNNILFAATGTGLYISLDQGNSWALQNGLNFKNIGSMSVTNDNVYVGTLGGGVYVGKIKPGVIISTFDEGYVGNINPNFLVTWSATNGPFPEIFNIQLKVDPTNSNIIYATSFPGGVFKSTDGGITWMESNFALPSFEVLDPFTQGYYSLEIDPNNSDVLYLGIFGKGVYKSEDGASTWIPMYGSMGQNKKIMKKGITQIKVDSTDSNKVYLATNDGVYISDNGAESWEEINKGLQTPDIKSLRVVDDIVYVGTAGYGMYVFNPTEEEWQNLGRTLSGGWWKPWGRRMYQFSTLLFDPDVPGKIYFGNFPGGFYISEDNGGSWKDSSIGLGNDGVFSLSVQPDNHNILWAGTYNGISKSTDKGKTWVMKGKNGVEDLKQNEAWEAWENNVPGIIPPEQWPYNIVIDNNDLEIMYISTKNGRNMGFCNRNCEKENCDENNFCGIVMKSINGGESWFEIMNGLDWSSEFYTLIIYPPNHDVLFLSTDYGVFLSMDAGSNWESMDDGLPTKNNNVRDNVADNLALSVDNQYLFLGLVKYGVWKADLSKLDLS